MNTDKNKPGQPAGTATLHGITADGEPIEISGTIHLVQAPQTEQETVIWQSEIHTKPQENP